MKIGTHFNYNNHIVTQDKTKFMQCLLIQHIQELAKTFHGFISSKHFVLVGLATID